MTFNSNETHPYQYTRPLYNPSFRLGEFWKSHVIGGRLDPEAGDGEAARTCLPIVTKNAGLRPALATLWADSGFQIKKDVLALWGAVLGDAFVSVTDDLERGKVYMELLHPGLVKSVELDPFGNIKGYEIEEQRPNPKGTGPDVTYRELVSRDGIAVVYETFLNDDPYGWDGKPARWEEPYGFVPLVAIQHNDVGLSWGWSELLPDFPRFLDLDDVASKTADQIRQTVDPVWLFSGVNRPKDPVKVEGDEKSLERPQPGREELKALYGPVGADAKPLVADLKLDHALAYIERVLATLEEDYPELSRDIHNASGEVSGRALRLNRSPAAEKVNQRRPIYDNALVRAFQMAIAIGGFRKYPGYEGFGLDSYAAGALDMSIGERPVFEMDELDDLEADKAFWDTASSAQAAGVDLVTFLKLKGWDEKKIAIITSSEIYKAKVASLKMAASLSGEVDRMGNRPKGQNL